MHIRNNSKMVIVRNHQTSKEVLSDIEVTLQGSPLPVETANTGFHHHMIPSPYLKSNTHLNKSPRRPKDV